MGHIGTPDTKTVWGQPGKRRRAFWVHILFTSFGDPVWVMNKSGLIHWPTCFNIEGYKLVFNTRQLMNSYLNTFIYVISISAAALGLLITILGEYALSRKDALWANPLMLVITFTVLFNGGMIPFYMVCLHQRLKIIFTIESEEQK